jgi:putative sigma-54 modulation protein
MQENKLQVTVTFRHVDSSEAIRAHAEERVQRSASKYLKNAQEAHVILSVVKQRHTAEINLHAAHFDISAHETTGDLYGAIDMATTKLEAQLRKHKDRINHHKGKPHLGGAPTMIPVDVYQGSDGPEEEDEASTDVPSVITTDNIPAKPLSVEDAILHLELSHQDFLVFRNSSTEAISVIYRRKDGNFGLIAPGN